MAHLRKVSHKSQRGSAAAAPAVADVAIGRIVWAVVHLAHECGAAVGASAAVDPAQQALCLRCCRHASSCGDQVRVIINKVPGGAVGIELSDVVVAAPQMRVHGGGDAVGKLRRR